MPFSIYPHPRPSVTVDVVLFSLVDRQVLLIRRKRDPFAGKWALPGGFVNENEDLRVAACREVLEETGLTLTNLRQVGAYGAPGRDPRGFQKTSVKSGKLR